MNTNDIAIDLPSSKSLSNRWLMMNHLCGGGVHLLRLSPADDTQLLRTLLRQLHTGKCDFYFCQNSGTVARFMLALLAATPGQYVLTGTERLLGRPMGPLIEALRQLGASITCTGAEGYLPVRISGCRLSRRTTSLDPSLSSQFVSALLLIAPLLPNGLSLTTTARAASRPYIDMTCQVLRQCGAEVRQSSNGRTYYVEPCPKLKPPQQVLIERDWTAASYFYTLAALMPGRRLRLRGLALDSLQGDSVVASLYEPLGVVTGQVRSPYRSATRSITMTGTQPTVKQLTINCIDCPDLAPSIAVACAALRVKTTMRGLQNLGIKESDRLLALHTELGRLGVKVDVEPGRMLIHPSVMQPVDMVHTYDDHRIAMAFAPLKVLFPAMQIENGEVVSKSFPDFWQQLQLALPTPQA